MPNESDTGNQAHLASESRAGKTEPRKSRGIVFFLRTGLFGIAALTIATILLSFLTFNVISRDLNAITRDVIPTIEQAAHLTELARTIESRARGLPNLYEPFAIGAAIYKLRELSKNLASEINQLDRSVAGAESIREVHAGIVIMNRQLERLASFVELRSAAEKRRNHQVVILNQLLTDIADLETSPAGDQDMHPHLTRIVVELFKVTKPLITSATTNFPSQLLAGKREYIDRLNELEKIFPDDPVILPPKFLVILDKMHRQVPMFDQRLDDMRLELRIDNAIKGLAAIDRLVYQVVSISTRLTQTARTRAEKTTILLERLRWILTGISIVFLIGLIAILLFIHRRIVGRMERLSSAMLSYVKGASSPISLTGNDEISDMAQSFMFYVHEVTRREKSLQERTLELGKILRELRESEQRLSLLVESSPLGIIEWDLDFRVKAWNHAAERIFKYTKQEAIGRKSTELILTEDVRPHVEKIWQDLLQQKGGERSTNENITQNGDRIICEWYNVPLRDEAGLTIGVASLVNDVTDTKKVETDLKQHLDDLERFNRLAVGREEKMIQLKEEINALRMQVGRYSKYRIVE